MKNFTLAESYNNCRFLYNCNQKNAKGETLQVEISLNNNCTGKHSLPALWKKAGYIDHVLKSYICVDTYVTDSKGDCWGLYNPTVLENKCAICFDWMFEANAANVEKLLSETFRRFMEC